MIPGEKGYLGLTLTSMKGDKGPKPAVRSEYGLTTVGYQLYLHGGQGSKLYSNITGCQVENTDVEWKGVRNDGDHCNFPDSTRQGHSFHAFNRHLIIFGGAGPYNPISHRKLSYNDIWVYSLDQDQYYEFHPNAMREDETERFDFLRAASTQIMIDPFEWRQQRQLAMLEYPSVRAYHASCVFGGGMFLHGGTDSRQGCQVLMDWHCFDFGLGVWIKISILELIRDIHGNQTVSQRPFMKQKKCHSMTPVYDTNLPQHVKWSRIMWGYNSEQLAVF